MTVQVGSDAGFLPRKTKRARYPAFEYPPSFDVGSGHNLPLLDEKLRLGTFRLLEERDDYLICKGYDPNAPKRKWHQRILVAKPWLLQRTPWDGATVTLGGKDVTFEYQLETQSGRGRLKRIARATVYDDEGNPEAIEEIQRITMDYLANDVITATQNRKTSVHDYIDARTETGRRIHWIDLNSSGRCWAVALDEEDE
jgi:hypothetical protein